VSDCRHEQIITYCYADTEEHAPLWACKQCGARFAPIKREIELEAQLAEKDAEIEALREDRERLEWLVNNNSEIRGNWICIHTYLNYLPEFRAAIDEAMGKDD
jgi:hypothetical protein